MPFTEIRGVECYYEKIGTGEPVVFVHGGSCSIETMRPQIDELSSRYEVHAPERPGHGRSPDRAGTITYEEALADTLAYLDAARLRSVHLVGFSDGAIIGLLIAIRHPNRLRSLVAISGNLNPSGTVGPDLLPHAMPAEAMAALAAEHDRLAPDGGAGKEELMARLMRMWSEEPDIEVTELDQVVTPTLVMAGDHDLIRTDHTVLIAQRTRGQLCIIPGASHMLMLERPRLVTLAISEFLAAQALDQPG